MLSTCCAMRQFASAKPSTRAGHTGLNQTHPGAQQRQPAVQMAMSKLVCSAQFTAIRPRDWTRHTAPFAAQLPRWLPEPLAEGRARWAWPPGPVLLGPPSPAVAGAKGRDGVDRQSPPPAPQSLAYGEAAGRAGASTADCVH